MRLIFIGGHKDFSVLGPVTGEAYSVSPGTPIEVKDEDGVALLERDADLWTRDEPPAAPAPKEPKLPKTKTEA